jgi:hypothetical protein
MAQVANPPRTHRSAAPEKIFQGADSIACAGFYRDSPLFTVVHSVGATVSLTIL